MAIPQLHPEWQPHGNVVKVGIGQFPQKRINSEVELGGSTPQALALLTEFFEQAEGVKLAVFGGLTHVNKKRTLYPRCQGCVGRHHQGRGPEVRQHLRPSVRVFVAPWLKPHS